MKNLEKIFKKFSDFLTIMAGILMAILTLVVSLEVVIRSFFNMPLTITTEMTAIIFPWIIGLTAFSITMSGEHMSLVFLRDSLNGKKQMILDIFINSVVVLFSVMMCIASVKFSLIMSTDRMPVLNISKGYVYMSIAVAFLGILLAESFKLICTIQSLLRGEKE